MVANTSPTHSNGYAPISGDAEVVRARALISGSPAELGLVVSLDKTLREMVRSILLTDQWTQSSLQPSAGEPSCCGGLLPVSRVLRALENPNFDPLLFERTALVVDDEPMVLKLLVQLLERRGIQVTACNSVDAAASAIVAQRSRPHRFDLVISDLCLADGSGADVFQRIVNEISVDELKRAGPPFILTTGLEYDPHHAPLKVQDELAAREVMHRVRVLPKPFAMEDLEGEMRSIIERRLRFGCS